MYMSILLYAQANDDLQKATNNYEAMNAQLLDELPKLFALSMDVVRQSLRQCVEIQKEFHNQALEEMYHMLEVNRSAPTITGAL